MKNNIVHKAAVEFLGSIGMPVAHLQNMHINVDPPVDGNLAATVTISVILDAKAVSIGAIP